MTKTTRTKSELNVLCNYIKAVEETLKDCIYMHIVHIPHEDLIEMYINATLDPGPALPLLEFFKEEVLERYDSEDDFKEQYPNEYKAYENLSNLKKMIQEV